MGEPYIELQILLKVKGVVSTGGQAKVMIQSGVVSVNSEIDTRVRRKLVVGDVVKVNGMEFVVSLDLVR